MPELRPYHSRVACPALVHAAARARTCDCIQHTVWPGHLAPDDPDLCASYLLLAAVNICDALASVERRSLLVVDALDLDERGVRVRVALASLVGQMSACSWGLVLRSLYSNMMSSSEVEVCSKVGERTLDV